MEGGLLSCCECLSGPLCEGSSFRYFKLVLVLPGPVASLNPAFLSVELSSVSPPSFDVLADANSLTSRISIRASDAEGLRKALRVVSLCFLFPQSIDPGQQFTWEHSNLEVNKPKNRYANVIAYDHSRVILAPIEGRAELRTHFLSKKSTASEGSRMTELWCRPQMCLAVYLRNVFQCKVLKSFQRTW